MNSANDSKLLVVVPARSGSKRLKNKNFKYFLGQPLYLRALEQALQLSFAHRVVLSTDKPQEQLDVPSGVIYDFRPAHLATDEASSSALAQYLWDCYGQQCQGLLWLQPTTPLRTHEDILASWEAWQGKGRLVTSCLGQGKNQRWLDSQGRLQKEETNQPVTLNGAIYFICADEICLNHWDLGARTFLMPVHHSLDIDTSADWEEAIRLGRKEL